MSRPPRTHLAVARLTYTVSVAVLHDCNSTKMDFLGRRRNSLKQLWCNTACANNCNLTPKHVVMASLMSFIRGTMHQY